MADVANKYAENVDGKFYVDDQCIDCDLCRETAPANSSAMTMEATPSFTNSLSRQRRKRFAKRRWKAVRSKRLVVTAAGSAILPFRAGK